MKFTAVGDALIQQRIPINYDGFDKIRDYICRGDARFFNLETTLNYEGECFASQFSGGTYMRANPEVLSDLKRYGFNMTSFNNNHAMDFSYNGLLRTLEEVNKSGLINSGVGHNLSEASAPKYLDTVNGRVALISVNTTFDDSMMAGEQSRRVPGRPGINGMRHEKTLYLSKEDFKRIYEIGEESGINTKINIERAQGYLPKVDEGVYEMGNVRFALGDKTRLITKPNKEDLKRVNKAIFEAKLQADYIIISVHSHEMTASSAENPPQFLTKFAHYCIDEGANAVIGHGPHLLRPIEIYKNCPIFYSLGNFILQLYSVEFAPEDFYYKQKLTSDETVHELIKRRSANFSRGLMEDKRMSQTVIPYWETEKGEITKLELLPVMLSMNANKALKGLPIVAEDNFFIEHLLELSKSFGTKFKFVDGIIQCSL